MAYIPIQYGLATLISGTATISSVYIKSTTKIFLSLNSPIGLIGSMYGAPSDSIVSGVSFVINSYDLSGGIATTDTSQVSWCLIN